MAWVAAMVWIRSLARELLHAVVWKKKKKSPFKEKKKRLNELSRATTGSKWQRKWLTGQRVPKARLFLLQVILRWCW